MGSNRGFYNDKVRLTVRQLIVLAYNLHAAQSHPEIGDQDIDRPFHEIKHPLETVSVKIPKGAIERALWACNSLDELGEFWHPSNESFEMFMKKCFRGFRLQNYEYDTVYNWLTEKDETND